jgi:hypothetical protein
MVKMLNRKRTDIGIVFPPHQNRHFEVDDQFYDADGYPIDAKSGKRLEVEQVSVPQVQAKAKKGKKVFAEPDDDPDAILDAPINLKAWAKGDEKHPWHAVQAQFQREYAVAPANKTEAYEILKVNKKVGLAGVPQVKKGATETEQDAV